MMTKVRYLGAKAKKFSEIGSGYVMNPNQTLMVPDAVAKTLLQEYPSEFEKGRDLSTSRNKMLSKTVTFKSK